MSELYNEALRAFTDLGGDPACVDAVYDLVGTPGIEAGDVTVFRQIGGDALGGIVNGNDGNMVEIGGGGRRLAASIRVVIDAPETRDAYVAARVEELKEKLGQ